MSSRKVFNPFDVYEVFKGFDIVVVDVAAEMTLKTFIFDYNQKLEQALSVLDPDGTKLFVFVGASKENCTVSRVMTAILKKQTRFFLDKSENDPASFDEEALLHLELDAKDQISEFLQCLADGVLTLGNGTVFYEGRTKKNFNYKFFTCEIKLRRPAC